MTQPIDRFLTGLHRGDHQVYVSWRLLRSDALDEPFHIERRRPGAAWSRITIEPATRSTDFIDTVPEAAL
ncbi:MAG: silent information regulator protein Sir2, partial [Anaerolineae bacterium]|nr:silent information regulator protein Sir2 [Anaerolineae bacterium]